MKLSRRRALQVSGGLLGASFLRPSLADALSHPEPRAAEPLIRLSLNENPYGPSPEVLVAIQRELNRLNRYAVTGEADLLAQEIADYERVQVDQVVLGEILGLLGLYLGSKGGSGGEFIYSNPGYLALIDAAAHVGGVGVPIPLDSKYQNDLPAISEKINRNTRAIYLVNPHNPTGTVNNDAHFKQFLTSASKQAVVIVDEAYLEYTADFSSRSAVSLVRDGANVMVFRTFDKIQGLAGLPIGYVLAPRDLASDLRKEGAGDAEGLGRLNIAAARAALADRKQVEETRIKVAHERAKWLALLDELKLKHTQTEANFVFFETLHPQPELADAMREKGIDIGRAHPPYTNWARITIGLPEENSRAQAALRQALR